jgi:hypothetical protein
MEVAPAALRVNVGPPESSAMCAWQVVGPLTISSPVGIVPDFASLELRMAIIAVGHRHAPRRTIPLEGDAARLVVLRPPARRTR